MAWLRLTARGPAGHGSMLQPRQRGHRAGRDGRPDRPARVAASVLTPVGAGVPRGRRRGAGRRVPGRGMRGRCWRSSARWRGWSARPCTNTANPTMLNAGYKVNVDPRRGDSRGGRAVPARAMRRSFSPRLDSLLGPGVQREFVHHDIAVETTSTATSCAAMIGGPAGRGPGRAGRSVLPVRRDRREVVQPAGHPVLRVRAPAPARRPRLLRHVPRRGRAGAGGRAPVRRAGAGRLPGPLLRHRFAT